MRKYLLYFAPIYLIVIILAYFHKLPHMNLVYGIIAVLVTLAIAVNKDEKKVKLSNYLIVLAFILIAVPRIVPYVNNNIPLGYDTGIYKYAIEHPFEKWMQPTVPRGLSFPLAFLHLFLPTNFILTYLLIGFELLLGFAIYKAVKAYFDKNTGIIALLLYSVSFVQFNAFTLMYYKNIVALSLMLFSFYFLKENKRVYFITTASLIGAIHTPTFLIFGLSYLAFTIFNYKNNLKINVVNGIVILGLTLLSYVGVFKESLFPGLQGVASLAIGAGTFMGVLQYQSLVLILVPFLFLGIYYILKSRNINILFIWFLINLVIVNLKLIFFNRYIIHLDIILIILASIGLCFLLRTGKLVGIAPLAIILLFCIYLVFSYAINVKPLIAKDRLNEMKTLQKVDGYVMSTHKSDSPWLLGYSGKETIAPGLFAFDKWNLNQWILFWKSSNFTEVKPLLDVYDKPIYIFVHPTVNRDKFTNECFNKISDNIYKYDC